MKRMYNDGYKIPKAQARRFVARSYFLGMWHRLTP